MSKLTRFILLFLCTLILAYSSTATATTIDVDLNEFYLDSFSGLGSIAADGSSAILYEDELLINDPLSGFETGIIVPDNLLTLSFDYSFTEYDDDKFYAWLFDGETGAEINYWDITFSSTGTYSFDLSGLDPSINLLGLEFGIEPFLAIGDQSVVISNLSLETTDVAPVPEPTTLVLLGLGLIGLANISRKKK